MNRSGKSRKKKLSIEEQKASLDKANEELLKYAEENKIALPEDTVAALE